MQAQVYNNEWINYNQNYYKIKVVKDGLHRLSYNTLNTVLADQDFDLSTIPVGDFQIWNNGHQVPIYIGNNTTEATGTMTSADFIEFYGEKNTGQLDVNLYKIPSFQCNPYYSLFSDTSVYFLSWSAGSNARLNAVTNDLTSLPSPETYLVKKIMNSFSNTYSGGKLVYIAGEYIHIPDFAQGEGWMDVSFAGHKNFGLNTPNVSFSSPMATCSLKTRIFSTGFDASSTISDHHLNINFNSTNYIDNIFDGQLVKEFNMNIPTSTLLNNNTLEYVTLNSPSFDKISIGFFELTYPRQYKFNGAKTDRFTMPSTTNIRYLEMQDLNATSPVLIDFSNRIRTVGITTGTLNKFKLPAYPGLRDIYVSADDASTITNITTLQYKKFIDFTQMSNQGDFIIITGEALLDDGTGHDYVEDYKIYRNSVAGGSFQSQKILQSELTDQFAFGIVNHPLAIRNFNLYALNNFTVKPKYELLCGKSVSYEYLRNSAINRDKCKVITWGAMGGDMLFTCAADSFRSKIGIGRISCKTPQEVAGYLEKVKAYEAQKNTTYTPENKLWMKRFLHLTGSEEPFQTTIRSYFNNYNINSVYPNPMGGWDEKFYKFTTAPVEDGTSARLDSFMNSGSLLLTFWGHGTSGFWDFDIGPVTSYNNEYGRYPIILSNSCLSGAIHEPNILSMSEEYVLEPGKGAIAYLSTVGLGFASFLHNYSKSFYSSLCNTNYNKALGDHIKYAVSSTYEHNSEAVRTTSEEYTLEGDPAIMTPYFQKPDYYIQDSYLSVGPNFITSDYDSLDFGFHYLNLAKAIPDDFLVNIVREFPNGTLDTIYSGLKSNFLLTDTISIKVVTLASTSIGLNKLHVYLDAATEVDEYSETNNYASIPFYIYSKDVGVVGPLNESMINTACSQVTLRATTNLPILENITYELEIDTTLSFTSPFLMHEEFTQVGGVIEWLPPINYQEGQIYYWRIKIQDTPGSTPNTWLTNSFLYVIDGGTGWAQYDYNQFVHDDRDFLNLNNSNPRFEFVNSPHVVSIKCGLTSVVGFGALASTYDHAALKKGSNALMCGIGGSVIVAAFDPVTGIPLKAEYGPDGPYACFSTGTYGESIESATRLNHHEFVIRGNGEGLSNLFQFLRNGIPDNYYYLVYTVNNHRLDSNAVYYTIQDSIYSFFESQGINGVRDIETNHPMVIWAQKNNSTYTPTVMIAENTTDVLFNSFDLPGKWHQGSIKSTEIGPSNGWQSVSCHFENYDPTTTADKIKLYIYGVKTNHTEVLLDSVLSNFNHIDISHIDYLTYPFLKLKLSAFDSTYYTPIQLKGWEVEYKDFCELTLSQKDKLYLYNDTTQQGDSIHFQYMVRNISCVNADSVEIKIQVNDKNNVIHNIPFPKVNIAAGDSFLVDIKFSNIPYVGNNILSINVNPTEVIRERLRTNNFAELPFYVGEDHMKPLVDATFDGEHILNGELIKPTPVIQILVKDENEYRPLSDTSDLSVTLRYPDGSIHPLYFSDPLVTFYPAQTGGLNAGNNEARIEYRATFLQDGGYTLQVFGRDVSGNIPTDLLYKIDFEVINKSMISKFMNYPNPFTTQTQFVFTLTGSRIPEYIKVQIMNVSGKVVREINLASVSENIRIGKNITNYAWDGTDQFGQPLANGLYLYRVKAFLQGSELEHYDTDADQFFVKKGLFTKESETDFGKMYLMR